MTVRFLDAAALEVDEAVAYYNSKHDGLGRDFATAVAAVLGRIEARPMAWLKVSSRLRRCRLSRFPYGVLYAPLPGEIIVVAVMHDRRAPMYWRDRLQELP